MKLWIQSFTAAFTIALWSGCATMPVLSDVEGISFERRELIANVGGSIHETVNAVRDASSRLQLASVKEGGSESGASLVAYDPHGTQVVIKLIPLRSSLTQVRIRAGVVGDEGYSRRILTEILKYLGE